LLDKSKVLLSLGFDLSQSVCLLIDLFLQLRAQPLKLANVVALSYHKHLQLLPLNVDVGALLFGRFL